MKDNRRHQFIDSSIIKLLEVSRKKFPPNWSPFELEKYSYKRPYEKMPDNHSIDELRLKIEGKFLINQVNRINGKNIKFKAIKKAGYKKDPFGKYILNDKGKRQQMYKYFSTDGYFTIDKDNNEFFSEVSRALPRFETHYLDSFSKSNEEQIPTVNRPRSWWLMKEFVDKDGTVYHFGKEVAELKDSLPPTEPKYPNKDVLKQSLNTVMDYLNKKYGNNIVAQTSNDKHSYNRKRLEKNIKGFWTISDWDGDYIATKAIYEIESYPIADYTDIE